MLGVAGPSGGLRPALDVAGPSGPTMLANSTEDSSVQPSVPGANVEESVDETADQQYFDEFEDYMPNPVEGNASPSLEQIEHLENPMEENPNQ